MSETLNEDLTAKGRVTTLVVGLGELGMRCMRKCFMPRLPYVRYYEIADFIAPLAPDRLEEEAELVFLFREKKEWPLARARALVSHLNQKSALVIDVPLGPEPSENSASKNEASSLTRYPNSFWDWPETFSKYRYITNESSYGLRESEHRRLFYEGMNNSIYWLCRLVNDPIFTKLDFCDVRDFLGNSSILSTVGVAETCVHAARSAWEYVNRHESISPSGVIMQCVAPPDHNVGDLEQAAKLMETLYTPAASFVFGAMPDATLEKEVFVSLVLAQKN